jgi:transcriptional regulator with XRE-family HTH domain
MARPEKDHPLYHWRKKHERSLTWLAGEVGCTQSHLSEIENRHNEPSLALATRLQRVTKLPVTVFLREPESAQ